MYVCKAVDETVPALATQVRWITSLANHPRIGGVFVLTRKQGPGSLPSNVTVRAIGTGRLARRAASFYRHLLAAPFRPDFYFVAQGGSYPALLLPAKLAARRPVYQWKAHPHVTRGMRFCARYCDDLVFTATEGSFPLSLSTVRVVGHGIDTDLFRPLSAAPTGDLVAIGRLSPAKRLDQVLEALAECRRRFGTMYRLDVVGPVYRSQRHYHERLVELTSRLDLAAQVRFLGSVRQHELPALLSRYRASVNFSATAFDKVAGEAMACGLPVVTTNPCVAESLPDDLRLQLVAPADDVPAQATTLHRVMSWDDTTRDTMAARLRQTVCDGHSLTSFFDTIIQEIVAHRGLDTQPA